MTIPTVSDILKTGMQFGHNTSRWNPKMSPYIFGDKNGIHVIDVVKSHIQLGKAVEFIKEVAPKGDVIFVGTKRQSAAIVEKAAIDSGSLFVTNRWPGGLFTNYNTVKRSILRLRQLENAFDEGVTDRTKYEVSRMKVEWQRLQRLYGGVKEMESMPVAAVIVDSRYERVASKECRKLHIPIISLADTNADPDMIDYVVPGNDDAIKSVELFVNTLAEAVLEAREGKVKLKHNLTDYAASDVEIKKSSEFSDEDVIEFSDSEASTADKQGESLLKKTDSGSKPKVKLKLKK